LSPVTVRVDRAALVGALLELVAERGFQVTSMAAVAERAGVAPGAAYVRHASKMSLSGRPIWNKPLLVDLPMLVLYDQGIGPAVSV